MSQARGWLPPTWGKYIVTGNVMKKSTKGTHKRLTDTERLIKRNLGVLVSLWADTDDFEDFLNYIEIDRKTLAKFKDPYQTAMPSEEEIRLIEKYNEIKYSLPENSVKLDNENLKELLQQNGVKFPPEIRNENIIKNNITALREYYHESKQELGAAIGVTRQTVAQYESKKSNRLPEQDKLIAIAYHFDVTVDELLTVNLDPGKLRNILINDKAIIQKVFLGLFHYFDYPDDYPEKDKSKEFLEALEIHDRLYEGIGEDTPWNHIEEIEKLMHLYCRAADQGCYEAIANHLWWLMYFGCGLFSLTNDMQKNARDILDKNTRVAELYKSSILKQLKNRGDVSESQVEKIQNHFLLYYESLIEYDIENLKNSDWGDLADYCIAIRYQFGIISNGLPRAMNRIIGTELLKTFYLLDNEYAVEYFEMLSSLDEEADES